MAPDTESAVVCTAADGTTLPGPSGLNVDVSGDGGVMKEIVVEAPEEERQIGRVACLYSLYSLC